MYAPEVGWPYSVIQIFFAESPYCVISARMAAICREGASGWSFVEYDASYWYGWYERALKYPAAPAAYI